MSEAQLQTLWANGAKAWADVPNASQWVEEVRGNVEEKRMSDTPRTDGYVKTLIDNNRGAESLEHFARQLERELNAANERIKLLEKAGEHLRQTSSDKRACDAWDALTQ